MIRKFSLTVAKIEMFRQDGARLEPGGIGTAFFYKENDEIFLITNWHNVTGVNPLTGQPLHKMNLLPDVLRIHYKQWSDATENAIRSKPLDIPLYENGQPIWLEHSERGGVDVAAIPLMSSKFENFANEFINVIDQETGLEVYAGMDCFILGFPEGLMGAANTPIWKRGSIASEPYGQEP
jgi:hypothetical protein